MVIGSSVIRTFISRARDVSHLAGSNKQTYRRTLTAFSSRLFINTLRPLDEATHSPFRGRDCVVFPPSLPFAGFHSNLNLLFFASSEHGLSTQNKLTCWTFISYI
ncbi:hypothetical protein QCA50_003790 [Cerrena zonata]|uniref:Uncharacterized protein n=1 Tax=Cerrena zonata TaxID=2478898 RepID=A0AAW0GRI4_9APHY